MFKLVLIWEDGLSSTSVHETDHEARQVGAVAFLDTDLERCDGYRGKVNGAKILNHSAKCNHGKVQALEVIAL